MQPESSPGGQRIMEERNIESPFLGLKEYHTPEKVKRYWADLIFHTRWPFYSKFVRTVLKYRKYALQGIYTDQIWCRSSVEILQDLEQCGAKIHIEGIDNIAKDPEPVVFVANHMSTAESMLLPGIVAPFRRVTFVVKRSLMEGTFFGPVMRSRNPVVVERKDPRADLKVVMQEGVERLKNGISVIVFPEGKRRNIFDPANMNSLGVKLAAKANVNVIPIALKTDFWGNGRFLKEWGPLRRKNPLYFSFGAPIPISEGTKQVHAKVLDYIQQKMNQWTEQKPGLKSMSPGLESHGA